MAEALDTYYQAASIGRLVTLGRIRIARDSIEKQISPF